MLVRARIKSVEMLPEWVRQECAAFKDCLGGMGEFVVDLSDKGSDVYCFFCGRAFKSHSVRRLPREQERWIPFDLIDLDEGLIEDNHA